MKHAAGTQLRIDDGAAGSRLDLFLARHPSPAQTLGAAFSRSEIQRLIDEGQITLNGAKTKASARIKEHDRIDINLLPPRDSEIGAEALPLEILYEDADCIVLNKAPGITVHPAAGHWSGTLVNALLHHCPEMDGIGGTRRPGIVHRLDKDTSGVMIIAKNMAAYHNLVLQFKNRTVEKEYIAIAWGSVIGDEGVIDRPIGRHRSDRKKMSSVFFSKGSREAFTEWAVEERFALASANGASRFVTLLRVRPRTGRTHQIRVHLADCGHPLLGDRVYGNKRNHSARKLASEDGLVRLLSRQALHAEKLTIKHVRTGRTIRFTAPLAEDLVALLDYLRCEKRAAT